jgi:GWxTD domain-containing protein
MAVHRRLMASVLGAAALLAACASTRGLKELEPKSRDFISKVRYTITAEERRAFLALAPEAREPFIEDFWKRRDPTPATAENEYRTEYFNRIERANHLFSGGGAPGWLQDRGRVYITLGPPDNRITYPRGITTHGLPTEIWWYGLLSIDFVDLYWTDDYRISPDSAMQIAAINQAQRDWNLPRQSMPKSGEARYAPALSGLEVKIEIAAGSTARFFLVIPYRNIWLKSSGDTYRAILETTMKVVDAAGAEAWTFAKSFPVEIPQTRLKEMLARDFTAEAVAALKPGAYTLSITVTNTMDGSAASLERKFEI